MKRLQKICLVLAISIGVIFFSLYGLGFRLYRVPSKSMEPTISEGSFQIGRLSDSYRRSLKRFDLIIYTAGPDRRSMQIKRVIGLPGETIALPPAGLTINGALVQLPECITLEDLVEGPSNFNKWQEGMVIPKDAIFVLGDNPLQSYDSRYEGPILLNQVVGKVEFQ
jgi:signal peptidase I